MKCGGIASIYYYYYLDKMIVYLMSLAGLILPRGEQVWLKMP